MTDYPTDSRRPLHFRPRHRLVHAKQFDAVYAAKVRKTRGPLTVFGASNGKTWPRLGLAVGVRVGGAVLRNRWKRLVREAFRLQQHTLARAADGTCYDLIVSVRAAPGQALLTLETCQAALVELAGEIDRECRRRARREAGDSRGQE